MTPSACSGGNETGKQLIDSRDGKSYWIAKLKDGNCWMTQNLDLDLANITLTPANSDVTTSWTPDLASSVWGNIPSSTPAYFNPGMQLCTGANCTLTSANDSSDAHYLIGNYYSWNAATAGTGTSSTANNAPSSICPKGWQLPISNSTSTNKSFGLLLNGLSSNTITTSPYYFVYSGYVNEGHLGATGEHGRYWSATASNISEAYNLFFDSRDVYPSDAVDRYFGLSVRCVAR